MKSGKIITISDGHIGNRRNPSNRMLKNIKELFIGLKDELPDIDLIINLGDSSDRLLSTRSREYRDYLAVHLLIAETCNRYGIDYIYLNGTPLHEMDQFDTVEYLIRKNYPLLKLIVFRDIEIYRYKKLDIDILAIPDEIIKDNDKLEATVDKLLKDNSLDKVDLILTHTIYKHQLSFPLPGLRDPEYIISKVTTNGFVLNGHVHTHSIYNDLLITIGSTDRIAHGEEEDKGIGILTLNPPLSNYKFIKNENALKFITINSRITLERLRDKLDKISKENDLAYIQFGVKSTITQTLLKELNKDYDNLILEMQGKKKRKVNVDIKSKKEIKTFEITRDNIYLLLKDRVKTSGLKEVLNKHI